VTGWWEYEFMRNAFLAGFLVSLAIGVVGTFVVLNRLVFLAGGIAHATYGGVGLGYLLGFSPVLGAFGFSVVSATALGTIHLRARERADTLIGVLWAAGMSLGVIFLDLAPGYKANLMSYLFGSILAIPASDLWLLAGLDVIVLIVGWLLFPVLVSFSFDPEYARVAGTPVWATSLALQLMTAVTVVMVMRVVGLVLVIALLAIPTAVAGRLTRRITLLVPATMLASLLFVWSGLALSYWLNLTSGATIVLTATVGYALVAGAGRLMRMRTVPEPTG
jgi:zinc transport system permease protein